MSDIAAEGPLPDRVERLLEIEPPLSVAAIAEQAQCHPRTVNRYAAALNKRRERPPPEPTDLQQQMEEMLLADWALRTSEIAERLGCDPRTVRKFAASRGLQRVRDRGPIKTVPPRGTRRLRVAAEAEMTVPCQMRLAADRAVGVRRAIASNPTIADETFELLAKDQAERVREVLAASERCTAADIEALASDSSPRVRAAAVANPSCPSGLVEASAADPSPLVRAAVVPLISDAEMVGRLAWDSMPSVAVQAARSPACPAAVLDALAGLNKRDLLSAVAANRSTSVETLRRIARGRWFDGLSNIARENLKDRGVDPDERPSDRPQLRPVMP